MVSTIAFVDMASPKFILAMKHIHDLVFLPSHRSIFETRTVSRTSLFHGAAGTNQVPGCLLREHFIIYGGITLLNLSAHGSMLARPALPDTLNTPRSCDRKGTWPKEANEVGDNWLCPSKFPFSSRVLYLDPIRHPKLPGQPPLLFFFLFFFCVP